jgi:hypothetical protein
LSIPGLLAYVAVAWAALAVERLALRHDIDHDWTNVGLIARLRTALPSGDVLPPVPLCLRLGANDAAPVRGCNRRRRLDGGTRVSSKFTERP